MAGMLTQLPLPLLPGNAREFAPGAGVVDGPDGGGVVWVRAGHVRVGRGGRGGAAAGGGAAVAAEGREADAGGGRVRGDPADPVAVAEGPGRRRGRGPGLRPEGAAAPLQADAAGGGEDPGAGRAGDAQGRHRRRGRGVGDIGAQRVARRRRRGAGPAR